METTRPLPLPPGQDHDGLAPERTRPSRRAWLIAAPLVLLLAVSGLVSYVGAHRTHVRADLRRVIGDLPSGWRVVAAKDAGVDTGPPFPDGVQIVLLGTSGDPTAPALELVYRADEGGPGFEALAATTGMHRLGTTRAAACTAVNDGTELCYVDERGSAIQLRANQVPVDELEEVIDGIDVLDGQLIVDTAAIPDDVELLASFARGSGGPRGLVGIGNADHPSVASLLYAGPDDTSALLVVGDADEQELAYAAVFTRWEIRTFRGTVYFVGAGGDGVSALWRTDGLVLRLRMSSAVGVDALLRAAASVRPPTSGEWKDFPPRPRYDEGAALGG